MSVQKILKKATWALQRYCNFWILKINGRRQWCTRGGTEIVCDDFVVKLTYPVPRREKKTETNLYSI